MTLPLTDGLNMLELRIRRWSAIAQMIGEVPEPDGETMILGFQEMAIVLDDIADDLQDLTHPEGAN